MRRLILISALACLLALAGASSASAAFGIKAVGLGFVNQDNTAATQAGTHPFALTNSIQMNTEPIPGGGSCTFPTCDLPDGSVKDLHVTLPPGFAGDPRAVPRCSAADFIEHEESRAKCPDATAVGIAALKFSFGPAPTEVDEYLHLPVYNLTPPPGVAARLGFVPLNVPVTVDIGLSESPPYNVEAHATDIAQAALFYGSLLTLWGDPSASAHDPFRGNCLEVLTASGVEEPLSGGKCPVERIEPRAFLTLPRSCTGPLATTFSVLAWNTAETDSKTALTQPGMSNCAKLDLPAGISAQPTSGQADSPTGLDFDIAVPNPGLTNPAGSAESDIKQIEVALPEGMTINPSQAEGLGVCSEADLARERAASGFGEGCPAASKIGTIEVETPLLEGEVLEGSLFVAKPHENLAGDSLIAFYVVIKDPALGIAVKQPVKVTPDPRTGQLIATTTELPQLPFSHFHLHFREGGRSPLITPPTCGTYTTEARFTPWANPAALHTATSSFAIGAGPGEAPCPLAGAPFAPSMQAGTLSNAGGSYSPFSLRLTRRDGDQDLTRFSAALPPGMVAKLAGVSQCPDAAIAAAAAKSGLAEQASPSCPASSQIGTVLAGAGVGSQLLYVPGRLYLAGPYNGAPLSVVAIVPAVAGPFDVGTVITRQALQVDPRTAKVTVDGSRSDPIPHILAGIPLRVRDVRALTDRPQFTLNPTSCDRYGFTAQLWGGGSDPFSSADDSPVSLSAPFQAASCASLGFKPSLSLRLKGGTRRGSHPALRAVVRPRPGDANIAGAVVRLPHSAFLEQAHIRTICTRVQFAAKSCPPGSVYGQVKAFTPLLDEPLQGPVYLRSSNHNLPDLVFALHGIVDFEAVARIDSKQGGIRTTFTEVPDAPIAKVVLEMQGGKKGLIVNSTGLCGKTHRANALLSAHNAKQIALHPPLAVSCPRHGAHHRRAR